MSEGGNRSVNLTVSVTGADGGEIPDGKVTFYDGEEIIGESMLESGSVTLAWNNIKVGTHNLKAVYAGNLNYEEVKIEKEYSLDKDEQKPLKAEKEIEKVYGDSAFSLNVDGGSGTGSLSYAVSGDSVSVDENGEVTILKAGESVITVKKAANDNYNEISVTVSIKVNKAVPVVAEDGKPEAGRVKRNELLSTSALKNGKVIGVDGKELEGTWTWKDGYTFGGWFMDKDCTDEFDFGTKVTKNITLYAKWTEKPSETEKPEETEKSEETSKPGEWKNPFDDVNEDDWFYNAVKYANTNELFGGVSDNIFAPNEAITRVMLVTVLWRIEKKPVVNYLMTFNDINQEEYYSESVRWAASEKIVEGYSETEFAPDKLITREEMAAVINRYADYKGIDTEVSGDLTQFTDEEKIADWARDNVSWAVGAGLISGKEDGILDPQGNTTRAETAAMLQRFLER